MCKRRSFFLMLIVALLLISGCNQSAGSNVALQPTIAPQSELPTDDLFAMPTADPATSPSSPDALPLVSIDTTAETVPFDPRLLGTNVPAWLGPERLADKAFLRRLQNSGTTVLRMPGGSWSNSYDWLGCELVDAETCHWTWAARPTDFLNLLRETGREGMWTVSINGTAQEAAALVAFFNGSIDDERPIGTDLRGRDWKTVGHWARLRAEHGNPEPYPIRYWEIGNEIYGGKEGSGKDCLPWGWEDGWTCDGREYVEGIGDGAERREGFLAFREAMRAVDPEIEVGAVGVADPGSWSDWGNEVIAAAGAAMDFYIVHDYAYDNPPTAAADVLAQPQRIWEPMMRTLRPALTGASNASAMRPVAVTEYNLVAFQDLDEQQYMLRAANVFFLADSLGAMAESGVAMANQWNFANGLAENGTDYGLINADTFERNPQYYAFVLWSRFGSEMMPVQTKFSAADQFSVYAGRHADGTISIMAINKTGAPVKSVIELAGSVDDYVVTADVIQADSFASKRVHFNGQAQPAVDFSDAPSYAIGSASSQFRFAFEPVSTTLLQLVPE